MMEEGRTAAAIATEDGWMEQVRSVALVRLDADGIVTGWNIGAERIKGYRAEDVIGTSFERFYRPEDRARHLPSELLSTAVLKGAVEDTGWRVRADGEQFWAHIIISVVRDKNGLTLGFLKVVRDLTTPKVEEDQRRAELLDTARAVVPLVDRLRTELDAIEAGSAIPAAVLARLRETVRLLSDTVVPVASRIERDAATSPAVPVVPIDIAEIVREAAAIVLPTDPHERLSFSDGPEIMAMADASRLRHALVEIIDNAAKYSEGLIHVALTRVDDELEIRVADRGRGIHEDDLDRVFEPHLRGALADPNEGGAGLGLTSARDSIAAQGGRISLISTAGRGTAVTIALAAA